jgi:ATP-dependent DNA helicase RecG
MIRSTSDILSSPIEYLKGVGPQRADLLRKELGVFTFHDLLFYFPFRHLDKSKIITIAEIRPDADYIQVTGKLMSVEVIGERKSSKRLVAEIKDDTGWLELVWFQGISWIQKFLNIGQEYRVFGKLSFFQGNPQITHPEIEPYIKNSPENNILLEPVYSTTEKLTARGMGGRQIVKLTQQLINVIRRKDIPEILPDAILSPLKFVSRFDAVTQMHFPESYKVYEAALARLKFEEFFLAQIRMGLIRSNRHRYSHGVTFKQVGEYFNGFYNNHLPFTLTNAQKKVLREIRKDTGSGKQMNRLLQGDVGSGKTIVALLTMLLAADNGFQSCLLAPTEILSRQHFDHFSKLLDSLPLEIRWLTGSTKSKERKKIIEEALNGELDILIGTHALIEDHVKFNNLGLAIVDEQHRFGVAQRAKLWEKSAITPHVLVMTATPIPRTLAMTAYGDLDCSVMDELPPGRQPIVTAHRYEYNRSQVMDFLRTEIDNGRQAYIIFPLIEESEKLDYENLLKGYENVKAYFPEPKYWISMVHGRQSTELKETNMRRFINRDTQIMVATTVIEVGVNVPNATVMIVESAEKFGLSQLHQLRGRVGRGQDKSFCILLTSARINNDALERLKIMCATNDGFKIAEKDLEMRGPGDISGTRQSGMMDFKLANIVQDRAWLDLASKMADMILDKDPDLSAPDQSGLRNFLQLERGQTQWSKIS